MRGVCSVFHHLDFVRNPLDFPLPAFFDRAGCRIRDWKLSISPACRLSPELVHPDIDDRAFQDFGQWPWDRTISAGIEGSVVPLTEQ
jgi:hypothetical protein